MTTSVDKARKAAVITINLIFGLCLVGWLLPLFATFFMFDAPAAESRPGLWSVVLSVWTYPLTYAIALTGSIIAYRRGAARRVTLGLALLPSVNIVWAFLSFAVLAR